MIKCCIIGASGYTGEELVKLITKHPDLSLSACYVSQNSADANKVMGEVHPSLLGVNSLTAQAIDPSIIQNIADDYDAIFLATPHEASHEWGNDLAFKHAKIFDLSGAFRLSDAGIFEDYYGFEHTQDKVLQSATYGLAEWYSDDIQQSSFVAVPGCYPTASLTGIKPIVTNKLLADGHLPIINATSGVSGAGKKPSTTTSYCEVSLQAYGVLGHRHTPEIAEYAGSNVIFTPHLGQFKRGILATITMRMKDSVVEQDIMEAFAGAYADKPFIRLRDTWPRLDDVVNTPFCDLCWKYDATSGYLIVSTAIDNVMKGAASQAIQCANLAFGLSPTKGLL